MASRGIWAAVGGAAQGFQQLWLKNYEQRLREQEELAREQREEKRRQKIREEEKADQVGRPLYAPQRAPGDTDFRAIARQSDGSFALQSFGQPGQGVLDIEQLMLEQGQADRERKIRLDEARIGAAERRARGGGRGSSGGGKSMTPGQQREAENQAIEEAFEDAGYYKGKYGRWYESSPKIENEDGVNYITGETEEKLVPQSRIAELRKSIRDERRGILNTEQPTSEPTSLSSMNRDQIIASAQAEYPDRTKEEIIAALKARGYID